ncbi:MAG: AraC family transcriptional regulator [Pseudomonadota bacterium]
MFRIDSYLLPGDACHVAHKDLARRWPEKAHHHDYFELLLVERGETDHWVNGVRQSLGPGQLVFFRPADRHAFRADPNSGCRIFNVMFRPETAQHLIQRYPEEFAGRFFDSAAPVPDAHQLQDDQFKQALGLATRLVNSALSLAQIEEFLLALGNQVLAPIAEDPVAMPNWLADACTALRHPSVFSAGTAGFVAVAGRSHEHLCRSCRSFLGTTPTAYVNRVRTKYAAERLVRTQLPIAEISAEVGIDNIGHFYRVFREQFGTTPRRYRVQNQKNPFE